MDGEEFLRRVLGDRVASPKSAEERIAEYMNNLNQCRDEHLSQAAKLDDIIKFMESNPEAAKLIALIQAL